MNISLLHIVTFHTIIYTHFPLKKRTELSILAALYTYILLTVFRLKRLAKFTYRSLRARTLFTAVPIKLPITSTTFTAQTHTAIALKTLSLLTHFFFQHKHTLNPLRSQA